MRRSPVLLAVVVLFSLACGTGKPAAVRDRACATACQQAEQRCEEQCPGGAGKKACEATCKQVEKGCTDKCQETIHR